MLHGQIKHGELQDAPLASETPRIHTPERRERFEEHVSKERQAEDGPAVTDAQMDEQPAAALATAVAAEAATTTVAAKIAGAATPVVRLGGQCDTKDLNSGQTFRREFCFILGGYLKCRAQNRNNNESESV